MKKRKEYAAPLPAQAMAMLRALHGIAGHAQAVQRPGGRFVEQPRAYDHQRHGPKDAGVPYPYVSAGKLAGDFWQAVFKALEELGEAL